MALFTDIRPEGIGRFFVRFIRASKSLSITWLKALEAPTMQYPPKAKRNNEMGFTASGASRYPAREEKTTLTASRALVISLKSEKAKDKELLFVVLTAVFIETSK